MAIKIRAVENGGINQNTIGNYVTVFDGSVIRVAALPTSRDVGYKYATVSDGFTENRT